MAKPSANWLTRKYRPQRGCEYKAGSKEEQSVLDSYVNDLKSRTPIIRVGGYNAETWIICDSSPRGNYQYGWEYIKPNLTSTRKVYMGEISDYRQIYLCATVGVGNRGASIAKECSDKLYAEGYRLVSWAPLSATVPTVKVDSCAICLGVREIGNWPSSWMQMYWTNVP